VSGVSASLGLVTVSTISALRGGEPGLVCSSCTMDKRVFGTPAGAEENLKCLPVEARSDGSSMSALFIRLLVATDSEADLLNYREKGTHSEPHGYHALHTL
jgi:hypothetical protein